MAIGDAVAITLGTAQTDRQPASGVEEKITMLRMTGSTDSWSSWDGTTVIPVVAAATIAVTDTAVNIAMMITNSVRLRKAGSSDSGYGGGVQTNV